MERKQDLTAFHEITRSAFQVSATFRHTFETRGLRIPNAIARNYGCNSKFSAAEASKEWGPPAATETNYKGKKKPANFETGWNPKKGGLRSNPRESHERQIQIQNLKEKPPTSLKLGIPFRLTQREKTRCERPRSQV